jgi:hypothetical protein
MPDQQLIQALAKGYNDRQVALNDRSRLAIGKLWEATVRDPTDQTFDLWVRDAALTDTAFRLSAAQLATAYVQTVESAMLDGAAWDGEDIDPQAIAASVRNGMPAEELWARPLIRLRALLGDRSLNEALAAARRYAEQTQGTNTAVSARDAASATMKASRRITGYRRVPNAGACRYCLMASTQRYHSADLMPMHGGSCRCTVLPIVGEQDTGQVIDKQLLRQLKAEGVKGDPAAAYRQQVTVKEHGELGPQLVPKGEHFAGPDDVKPTRLTNDQREVIALQAESERLAGVVIEERRIA